MRFSRSRLAVVAALTVPALLLSACSSDSTTNDDAGSGGDDDRSLIVYSGRSESLIGPLIEQFEKESGITVKVRYANSIEMAAQLLEEGERTPAQVFLSQEAGALGALRDASLLTPLPENITSAVEAHYTSDDGSWVAVTGRARVAIFNTDKLQADAVPANVKDLTKPEWKGRVGFAPTNASFQSFITAMRVLDGEEATEQWLRDMIANDVESFSGNGPLIEAVDAGALEVGLTNHYYWVRNATEAGGTDKMTSALKFGEPGTVSALVNVTGAGILKGSENNPEALEFLSYLVSEKGQQYFVDEAGEYALIPNGPSPQHVPALKDLQGPEIDYSKLADLEGTVELLQKVGLI